MAPDQRVSPHRTSLRVDERHCSLTLHVQSVACIVMPLALDVVSARLSTANSPSSSDLSAAAISRQARLATLMEAMKAFLPQYDGVELIKETVKLVADMAQTESQAQLPDAGKSVTNWAEIMSTHPALYAKMTLTVDLTISKGRLAGDADIPAWLLGQMSLDSPSPPGLGKPDQIPGAVKQTRDGHDNENVEEICLAGEAGATMPQPQEPGPGAWWEGLLSPDVLIAEFLEGCNDPYANYGPDGPGFEQPLVFEDLGNADMAGINSIHDLLGPQGGAS